MDLSINFLISATEAAEVVDSDIIWDRIVVIEYLGYEHVYDIEVEGTHNFIGNGIFAHNTYINKGGGNDEDPNISCGTICESGHERSYNALDEQLKRQFEELTEEEADRALVEYAKRFGIEVTLEQLQKFRKEIKAADEAFTKIQIFFSIPETGTELFWVGEDYAGGHFNRAGTRIHISLLIILKRGIQVGIDIAWHELRHIKNSIHLDNDQGSELVRKIATTERFIDNIKGIPAKTDNKKIILALDTDIGDMSQFEIDDLLRQIKDVSSLLENIDFVAGRGDELTGLIEAAKTRIKTDNIDVIVVTKKNKKDFDSSYHVVRTDDSRLDSGSYVPILELFTFALLSSRRAL